MSLKFTSYDLLGNAGLLVVTDTEGRGISCTMYMRKLMTAVVKKSVVKKHIQGCRMHTRRHL